MGPKTPPRRPKGVQKGAQKLTFRSPKRHFWEPKWREWPFAKTPAGAMFSSHYEGPGPSLFAPKIVSGTRCALETFFFRLLCPLWSAKWGPRSAKWNPRSPQGSQKGPKGAPNPSQNRSGAPSVKKSGPGGSRGALGKENDTKI